MSGSTTVENTTGIRPEISGVLTRSRGDCAAAISARCGDEQEPQEPHGFSGTSYQVQTLVSVGP